MRARLVDPVGWDRRAGRMHDVEAQPDGRLLHFSTCWCRGPRYELADFHPETGHLHTCAGQRLCNCAGHLYVLADDAHRALAARRAGWLRRLMGRQS